MALVLPRRLRSLLFAPAVRPDLLRKMPASGADAIVIDLEDATPPDAKAVGRDEMRTAVAELEAQVPIFVRINDDTTPWHEDDLESLPAEGLAGIVVPKIETTAGLDTLADRLAGRASIRTAQPPSPSVATKLVWREMPLDSSTMGCVPKPRPSCVEKPYLPSVSCSHW